MYYSTAGKPDNKKNECFAFGFLTPRICIDMPQMNVHHFRL